MIHRYLRIKFKRTKGELTDSVKEKIWITASGRKESRLVTQEGPRRAAN